MCTVGYFRLDSYAFGTREETGTPTSALNIGRGVFGCRGCGIHQRTARVLR